MYILKISVLILLTISAFVILVLSIKSKKIFRFLFLNAMLGLSTLLILIFTKKSIGVTLPINEYTVIGSSIFGVPAIVGFLLLNLVV